MIFSLFITQDRTFITNTTQILIFWGRSECDRKEENDDNKNYRETDETAVYDGASIVLDDLVRDTLLVAEPLRELCKSDCKGLCPVCGQNLNEGQCDCDTFVPDPRLAALESLLKND